MQHFFNPIFTNVRNKDALSIFLDHKIWTHSNNVRHDLFQLSDETVIVYGIVFQSILFIVVQKNMNIF